MTPCQACHVRDAEVELTQVMGDEVTTLRLCGKCAAERGTPTESQVTDSPLGAFLAAMGQGATPLAAAAATGEPCPTCGATLGDFRASGRLGCADCWVAFERPLRDLLRRVHGGTRHVGRRYLQAAEAGDPSSDLIRERLRLREALRDAVTAEHFELAAELRDRLRGLEG
ncbi:MAG: UvrB/UvrC motif-containing protein [Gemmatimonadales bacterium]